MKKRRDKKYNPWKSNPLDKKLKSAIEYDYKDAIVTNDKGEIKLDEAGKPIFKDIIEWTSNLGEINAIWHSVMRLLEQRLVPPNEEQAAFDLLSAVAKMQRDTKKDYKVSLPINYFVGMWHCLNSSRKFGLWADDKGMDDALTDLTLRVASQIDRYHKIKQNEALEDEQLDVKSTGLVIVTNNSKSHADKNKEYY